jgi:hypothetical protein
VPRGIGDARDPDRRDLPRLVIVHLRDGQLELVANALRDAPDDLPLVLE